MSSVNDPFGAPPLLSATSTPVNNIPPSLTSQLAPINKAAAISSMPVGVNNNQHFTPPPNPMGQNNPNAFRGPYQSPMMMAPPVQSNVRGSIGGNSIPYNNNNNNGMYGAPPKPAQNSLDTLNWKA